MEFFFRYLWNFIGYGLQFIRGDPRRAITDPTADVDDFVRRYEAEFGSVHPDFYRGTYSQALQEAKKELKFLLVYLHCDDHIDTAPFCRLVMPNQGFRDLIRENMIFWACSVSKPEGYRTSQALRENTYPFLALIVLKNNRMTVVARVEGVIDPEELLGRLHQGVADNEAFLVAERQERLERSMTQTLRAQQDEAYQESLRADQEKDRKKREAEEKKRQAELEKQRIENEEKERKESMKQRKSVTLLNLKQEPAPDAPNVIRCIIKLPNGQRLERRFLSSDSLKHLYNFVFSHPQSPDLFEIATNFPKRTLPCKPTSDDEDPPTFTEVGLQRNEMLFVYDLES
jgi:FAS-associated factor 2